MHVTMLLYFFGQIFVAAAPLDAGEHDFHEKVAPILQRHCIHCHSGDKPGGGLNLTAVEQVLAGGESGPPVVPGDADGSFLLDYVTGPDPEMPKEAAPLSEAQVAILRTWIAQGAKWPQGAILKDSRFDPSDWWSLKTLEPVTPPKVDSSWPRNAVDRFIFKKLQEMHLSPSAEADRRTLIRRLTYDLHGLPPTPEDVDAFLDDANPGAYERLVDRLLASPRYGERWGRHWLDIVHYGDTHGFDKDKRRPNAWRYRDYVIDSFNQDKPYDQFILEQLAGDVLFPGEPGPRIATGFIAAGPWDFVGHVELREGTTDKEITRLLDRDDMVMTTLSTFASLTVHCARCHDHPFDPIRQEEYYKLQAVFAGLDRADVDVPDPDREQKRRELAEKLKENKGRQQKLADAMQSVSSPELVELDQRLVRWQEELGEAEKRIVRDESGSPSNGYHGNISNNQEQTQWVQLDLGQVFAIDRIDLFPARPTDFPDTPGFGFPLRFKVTISDNADFTSSSVVADFTEKDFASPGPEVVRLRAEGIPGRYVRVTATKLWPRTNDYVFALGEVQVESGGKNVALHAAARAQDSIEAGRWSTRHLTDGFDSRGPLPDIAEPALAENYDRVERLTHEIRSEQAKRDALADSLVPPEVRAAFEETSKTTAALEQELAALEKRDQVYAVRSLDAPRSIHLLHRGDVKNPKQEVSPGSVACVQGLAGNLTISNPQVEGDRRAALAKWMTDERNSLTWRSIVNRVWQYHFGQGIVDTPSDFGRLGSEPTHPGLLDWLALEFLANGKSLKWLHKQIVTSATYRQVSEHRVEAATIDCSNRYLWRMNRQRLDAETIRDSVLMLSGKLDLTMGGPGYDLFGFKDDHSPHYKYEELDVDDPKTYRRSVYRFVVRSVPDPWMECLDCADPSLLVPVRDETITALQALALLNNKFLLRQAEHFASRLEAESKETAEQIGLAYRLALCRAPTRTEAELLAGYAKKHGLPAACRVLLNTSEWMFVD